MPKALISILTFLLIICSCKSDHQNEITTNWKLHGIDNNKSNVSFQITGLPEANNWTLYFSHIMGVIDFSSIPKDLKLERIAGDFFKLYPLENFKLPKDTLKVHYDLDVVIQRQSDAPGGLYYTIDNGAPIVINNYKIEGINSKILSSLPLPTAQSRFKENANLTLLPKNQISPIIPRPKSFIIGNGSYEIKDGLRINAGKSLANEIKLAQSLFEKNLNLNVSQDDKDPNVNLKLGYQGPPESYSLEVSNAGINILARDNAGAFYGLQSLMGLIDANYFSNQEKSIAISHCVIKDQPRFSYRGVHLDVARNFHTKDKVVELLELMSQYKLNKFHFHITDDEGWRIEIPGLPELTDIGSKRGHTLDESENLVPHYGSGPIVDGSTGTGYYTRAEFIDILQYADARHIEVIPEIDIPSHARAAIKSMASRYKKYMDQGDEAEAKKYLLHDFDDKSEYSSAQNFSDNIVCVCQESTYDFVEKVIDELVAIFEEANVPIYTIHSGGDELPYGPWQKSPICKKFIDSNSDVNHTDDLHAYFMKRFKVIMDEKGLNTAGWEEIVLKHSKDAHDGIVLNEEMIGQSYIPYVWNAVWGWGREDMAYKLANAGYEIIFCNSASLYMDMAYNKDPDETGLSWSGWTSTKTFFDVIPLDIFANAKYDKNGNRLKQEDIDNKIRLTAAGRKNFKGIQGQIWCETITSPEKLEYMVFPKMLALAERAWGEEPSWSDGDENLQNQDWNNFANNLGQIELKKLDHKFSGINYRIPLPGAKIMDGQLFANTKFPGLEIRYTTDGSEPDKNSNIYTSPINISAPIIKLKTFASNGRSSRTVSLE